MKPIFLFLLLLFSLGLNAQVKPIYFNKDSVVKDSTKATAYGVYGKLSNEEVWRIKLYDLYDNLLLTGSYQDEKLSVPHGRFIYYDFVDDFNDEYEENFYLKSTNRFLSAQGEFNSGQKTGRWVTFFPDGKIRTVTFYIKGVEHGEYKLFNRRGKVEVAGMYASGVKVGEWNYASGKKEVYRTGVLISTKN